MSHKDTFKEWEYFATFIHQHYHQLFHLLLFKIQCIIAKL